jgi:Putative beta-barrel porin-2, OmpL-like. bbp2
LPGSSGIWSYLRRLILLSFAPFSFLLFHAKLLAVQDASSPTSTTKTEMKSEERRTDESGFFDKLLNFYKNDWNGTAADGPELPRRIPPPPLDSPPFPNADWEYGGAPDIGAPDTNVYPLMEAINGASSKVKIYGWIEPGADISTSRHTLFPLGYNVYSNTIVLDQAVLYIERLADTVQTDHVDWGFHLTGFYGVDYRFTTAKGWFSQQLLKFNRQYGFDPMLEYVDVYVPQIADGLNVRVGRYLSVPDIEAQLAPNNYLYSHSLLYSFDPFTQTGILATLKLNNRWLVQSGLSAGNDIAPWADGAKPSLTACVSYTFREGKDNVYPCVSGINSGKYAYNNVQFFVNTWYHKFNAQWHTATEAW